MGWAQVSGRDDLFIAEELKPHRIQQYLVMLIYRILQAARRLY